MDLYDPQMLGVMVFGGFMLVSAIGIFLVSTFSMKETSYEEALAKQRKELEKASQHKVEKKKKEKPVEKKGKARKKEEKPNGRISEPDLDLDAPGDSKDASPESASVDEPTVVEAPVASLSAPPLEKEKVAPSPKDKKKKEKKAPKVEPEGSPPPVAPLKVHGADETPKQPSVAAVPPAESPQANPLMDSVTMRKTEALGSEDHDGVSKKKAALKKKKESIPAGAEGALFLPYNMLVSTIDSMVFGEGETQRLIEILTEKAGTFQDTWHTATQKGDPVVVLKRQLEEKEKQLATEQENATLAKTKLREIAKELGAEKAKALTVENKLKEQMLAHEKEMAAVQARMQTSYQDHVTETQQLQGKIRTLQEQLENGPNTQLACLQQENSILRDALNQATSQTESKQNAELAKLRQECSKRSKELTEKLEMLQQAEEEKAALETKATAYEGQIYLLQASQKEKEALLQKRLDEVNEELGVSQANYKSLQAELGKAKEQQASLAELESKFLRSEQELQRKEEELSCLQGELSEATSKSDQLAERIRLTEAPLQAGQILGKDSNVQAASQTEVNLLQLRLQESSTQVSALEAEAAELRRAVKQLNMQNSEALEQHLEEVRGQTKQMLAALFPQVLVEGQQAYDEWLQEFKDKASLLQLETAKGESDMALSLSEADEGLSTLQAECNQYRTILAETERMLKELQKSVEEEEQVWKAKVAASQEALDKSQDQLRYLEDDVQKLKVELQKTDKLKEYTSLLEAQLENHLATANSERQNYTKEVEVLRQLLCESQEHLDTAKTEALRQSQELAQLKSQLEQTEVDLHSEHILREKLAAEFEEAQNSVCSLQTELEKLRREGNVSSSATEDILHLQGRLENEKKLTKDLGCAATKLKELLTVTQEQLAKERENVKKLREEVQDKGETEDGAKEGTSV